MPRCHRRLHPCAALGGVLIALGVHGHHATPTHAAGMSTHFECVDMAITFVQPAGNVDLLMALSRVPPHLLQDGSIFPDWGYAIGLNRDAAELAHKHAFHEAALDHLFKTYGPESGWGPHEQRLFAFIFGIASHVELDDAWHFGHTALLRTAMREDNASDFQVEVSADLFVQSDHRPGLERFDRWLPVADMIRVYENLGRTDVTRDQIITGSILQYVALYLEDAFGWMIVRPARDRFPWTEANYLGWWDGGVRNGATLTARTWERMWASWLERTTPEDEDGIATTGTRHAAPTPTTSAASTPDRAHHDIDNADPPTRTRFALPAAVARSADVFPSHPHAGSHALIAVAAELIQAGAIEVHIEPAGVGSGVGPDPGQSAGEGAGPDAIRVLPPVVRDRAMVERHMAAWFADLSR